MAVSIAIESPLQDDVRQLISELNATLLALTPAEFCFHMTVEQMADASTTVWIARDGQNAFACGALKRHDAAVGEVKRMYTRPEMRGQGLGKAILAKVIEQAVTENFRELVLETGSGYEAAISIYTNAGFARCEPVLDYPDSPHSICFRKQLAAH